MRKRNRRWKTKFVGSLMYGLMAMVFAAAATFIAKEMYLRGENVFHWLLGIFLIALCCVGCFSFYKAMREF